jgi:flavodoxin
MKTLIVLKSIHHHNTERIAAAMAEVLAADVRSPEEVDQATLEAYDLIGLGSGIYYARFHSELRSWSQRHRAARPGQKAFIFTTSGLPFLYRLYHYPLRQRLIRNGFDVVADFHCSGHDTFGPLWLFGGLHRRHPNADDLSRAAEFGKSLQRQLEMQGVASDRLENG